MSNVSSVSTGAKTFKTDSGTATADNQTLTIAGGDGISTSGASSTVTIDLDTPVSVSDGGTGTSSFTEGSLLLGGDPLTDTGVLSKGDLVVGDGSGAPSLLAVGQNGQILTASSLEASGLEWSDNVDVTAFGEQSVAEVSPQVLIHFPYNLNTDIINTSVTGSGTVTHSGQFAVIDTGAASSSSATLLSNRFLEYHPGQGALARFTAIFTSGVTGNTQIVGPGSSTDGFFFGYDGETFSVLRRSGGSDFWVPQASWNVDTMDGTGPSGMTLDPAKGNVFQIRYQWLGFGAIRFYVEDETTGMFQLVHTIKYTNQNILTSTENPSFPFCVINTNTTNTSSVVIKIPSLAMFIEGKESNLSHTRNSIDNEKTLVGATETNVVTIRNKSTYQSLANAIQIQPDFITVASEGTKTFTYKLYINATLGGVPSFNDISVDTSVVDFDIAGTTVSDGTLIGTIVTGRTGQASISLADFGIIMAPGQTLTVSGESANAGDATVGISWQERFS